MANEKIIWDFLKNKGLNNYAVAGLMGNLYAESTLKPDILEIARKKKLCTTDEAYTKAVDEGTYTNFVHDSVGYGLAQWTYWSQKEGLLNFAKTSGKSIGDLEMQLEFLWKELQGNEAVMQGLTCANSVLDASNVVLLEFECPADQGEAVQCKRLEFGLRYYDKFAC